LSAAAIAVVATVAAAILGQVADQLIHRSEIGAVDELAAVTAPGDETGALETLKMERQGGGRKSHPFTDDSRREAFRAPFNQ